MAQFEPALNFVLDNEDRLRVYAIVPDAGGYAIAGVNSRAWPQAYAEIAALPQDQRGPAVASFYRTNYWNVMHLEGLDSQDLADRVMDEGVNGGSGTGIKMLQATANTMGCELVVDGSFGPASMAAVNGLDQAALLNAYRQARLAAYRQIVALRPADAQYLQAWEARALL